MKQVRIIFVYIVLLSVYITFFPSAFSQSYQDDFNVLNEKNWVRWGDYSIWKVENGYLKNWIQGVPALIPGPRPTPELLQFKGLPGPYENIDIRVSEDEVIQRQINKPGFENLKITLKDMVAKRVNFGIALGWMGDSRTTPFYYLFMTSSITTANFNGWGGVSLNRTKLLELDKDLDKFWNIQELKSMEVRFNSGNFQWFADGEKRAEFVDPNYSPIEILGFVVIGSDLHVGHAWVNSFKISGPGLSVSPKAKLTTTWGELKHTR